MKRQRWTKGSIVKIYLENGLHSYAQLLDLPLAVFYDVFSTEEMRIGDIISQKVLFSVWVMKYAITKGEWLKVGSAAIPKHIEEKPVFFKYDPHAKIASLYYGNGIEKKATLSDIEGLECAAVWDPSHVIDRLHAHLEGKPCKWVESLKPKF